MVILYGYYDVVVRTIMVNIIIYLILTSPITHYNIIVYTTQSGGKTATSKTRVRGLEDGAIVRHLTRSLL